MLYRFLHFFNIVTRSVNDNLPKTTQKRRNKQFWWLLALCRCAMVKKISFVSSLSQMYKNLKTKKKPNILDNKIFNVYLFMCKRWFGSFMEQYVHYSILPI